MSLRFPSGRVCAVLAAAFGYLTVLGNKNELFSGLVMGGLFYLVPTRRVRWGVVTVGAVACSCALRWWTSCVPFPVLDLGRIDWWESGPIGFPNPGQQQKR